MEFECDVYRSNKTENLFLYVDAKTGLDPVPADLLESFGDLEKTLTFTMSESRRLAKEDPKVVLANLNEKGYHLQMPPTERRFHG